MYDIVFKYDETRDCIFISEQDEKIYNLLRYREVEYDGIHVESENVPELNDGVLYVRGDYEDHNEDAVIHGCPLFDECINFTRAIIALEKYGIKVGVDFDGIQRRVNVDKCKELVYTLCFDVDYCSDLLKCVCDYGGFKCLI